jgi:hypothetical protein
LQKDRVANQNKDASGSQIVLTIFVIIGSPNPLDISGKDRAKCFKDKNSNAVGWRDSDNLNYHIAEWFDLIANTKKKCCESNIVVRCAHVRRQAVDECVVDIKVGTRIHYFQKN